jgi:hypothetical protein
VGWASSGHDRRGEEASSRAGEAVLKLPESLGH